MFKPSLQFLRQVVHPHIREATAETIKVSASPSTVYRVFLAYGQDVAGDETAVPSVIVKRIAPNWPHDPHGPQREACFYSHILPQLDLCQAHVYYAGVEPGNDSYLVVMADMGATHRFPPPTHTWTEAEIRPILRTYARFHAQAQGCLPPPQERGWLFPRYEERVLATAADLLPMVDDLVAQGIWPPLPRFPGLVERTVAGIERWASYPVTLLHNDVTPANAALPHDPTQGNVLLVDWEMLGWGLAEMDLAYMFMQPFRCARAVDRKATLDYYWQQRRQLAGPIPTAAERRAVQHHADAVAALWHIPTAHRLAADPYPPGSAPRAHWQALFPVLGQRLQALCHEI